MYASIVDQNGVQVPRSRISGITLRDSAGEDVAFPVGGRVWLDGQVPVYRNSALEMRTEVYSLQRVMVQGTNTVNVGEQSLRPADRNPVVFRTRFYDLTVVAHDALFKRSADGTARVRFPDGSVRLVVLGPDRSATLRELPRGVYTVDLVGNGTAVSSLVTLSRPATVDITVATTGDLVTLALIGLGLALGLVVFGRGRHRTLRTVLATGRWTGSLAAGAVRPVTRPLLRVARGGRPGTVAGPAVPGVRPGAGGDSAGPGPADTKPLGLEPADTEPAGLESVTCELPVDGVTEELSTVDPAPGEQTPADADPGPVRPLPAGELVAPGMTSRASPEEGSRS